MDKEWVFQQTMEKHPGPSFGENIKALSLLHAYIPNPTQFYTKSLKHEKN